MTDITEKNRLHWGENASTYDSRFEKTIAQLTSLLRKKSNLDFIGANWVDDDSDSEFSSPQNENKQESHQTKQEIKLLDYACGTGLVTRALMPYVTRSIGIDLSREMAEVFNRHAGDQGLGMEEMRAYEGNLIEEVRDERFEGDEFWGFDLLIVELAFHHFHNVKLAAGRLAERLKPGGILVIIDFESHDGEPGGLAHHHSHSHSHAESNPSSKQQAENTKEPTKGDSQESGSQEEVELQLSSLDAAESQKAQSTVTHNGFSEEGIRKVFEEAGVGMGFGYKVLGKGVVFHAHGVGEGEGEKKEMRRGVFMARGVKG